MKTECLKNETGRLPQEALVLETLTTLGNASHVPEILDKGRLEADRVRPKQFIVMTLLGPDLAVKKVSPDHKLSASTVVMIVIQGIDACSVVHNAGFVHRDIKLHNFMIGIKSNKHKIYMIDFGLARRIVDADGNLLKPREVAPFKGTLRCCAMDCLKGAEYGKHHDLWLLFHPLIDLRAGDLPWATARGDPKKILEVRSKLTLAEWLANIEPEYLTFYEHLTTLRYAMTPEYERFQRIVNEFWTI